jgi:hypothetical protein
MNQPLSKPTPCSSQSMTGETITLDYDHILTHAGGDPDLLMQLCAIFLNELPIHMESLCIAMKKRGTLPAQRALLRLSNCLMLFGPGPLSSTMEAMEVAIRSDRKRPLRREWLRLQLQLQNLVPQVQRLMLEVSTPKCAVQ